MDYDVTTIEDLAEREMLLLRYLAKSVCAVCGDFLGSDTDQITQNASGVTIHVTCIDPSMMNDE